VDLLDITVVILSRGREQILARTLAYWSEINVSVLVLHNTESPLDPLLLGPNIEYRVMQVSYGERCGTVSKYLKNEFAILCADDEIYIPSALLEMKTLLKNEANLASVGGLTIAVGKYGPMETGTHSYSNMKFYKNDGADSYERLKNHFADSTGYRNGGIYRLMRKNLMIELMKILNSVGTFSTPYIYEVTGEIVVNSYGPARYLNNIYWVRNWINDPVVHKNWNRKFYFADWVTDTKYSEEVRNWHKLMMSYLHLSKDRYEECIQDLIKLRRISESREIVNLSKKSIPVPSNLKWLTRKLLFSDTLPSSFEKTLSLMRESGAIFDQSEITHAKSFLS